MADVRGAEQQVEGNVADNAADAGMSVKIGGIARSVNPSDNTNAARTPLWVGLKGQIIIGCPTAANVTDNLLGAGAAILDTAGNSKALAVVPYHNQGAGLYMVRTPSVFKTATATASGDTALWTPTSGKKFRLMRILLQVTQDALAAAAADLAIFFKDGATVSGLGFSCFIPAAAGTTLAEGWTTGWIDLGNGLLSAAANNVLNLNLSFALTGGLVRATVAGTEE